MASSSTPPEVGGDQPEAANQQTKSSRQRFKPQLSCTLCRTRKLKCDRQLPCGNCTRRGISASCTFVHGNQREKSTAISKGGANKGDVHSQIQNLEELVLSIMNRGAQATPQPSSTDSNSYRAPSSTGGDAPSHWQDTASTTRHTPDDLGPPLESLDRISIDDKQASYVGDSHWTAILENIAGLKDTLEAEQQPESVLSNDNRGPDLLLGGALPRASRAEILSTLPQRRVVDAYIQDFLDTVDMGADYIHRPTFEKECEKFWKEPSKTPISWLGLLYIVICLSTHYSLLSKTNNIQAIEDDTLLDQAEAVELYRMRAVQCLILSNYTEPDHYTIPTLLLYYIEEHFRTSDAKFGTWMLFGMVVRAAMRLGYHRDASNNPKISFYRGEMQRRHWSGIVFFDMQNSLQVGLPRMIREDMFDTKPPHNIIDTDFNEYSTSIPPVRPFTEIIPINFSNCKHKLMAVCGRIIDQANSTDNIPYHEIMALDAQLAREEALIPPMLRTKSLSDLYGGTPDEIFRRWQIDLVLQKSRIILHRRFLFPNKSTGIYSHPYSVKTCVDAGMTILQSQLYMFERTQPGKEFHGNRWKASSLMMHDFLLGAMIVCLHVGHSMTTAQDQQDLHISWKREQMVQALNKLNEIYNEKRMYSQEAAKASRTLKVMLDRVRKAQVSQLPVQGQNVGITPYLARSNRLQSFSPTTAYQSTASSNSEMELSSASSATSTIPVSIGSNWEDLGMSELQTSSTTSTTNSNSGFVGGGPGSYSNVPSSSSLDRNGNVNIQSVNDQFDFNWDLWDSHFQPSNIADTPPELWNFDFDGALIGGSDGVNGPQQVVMVGVEGMQAIGVGEGTDGSGGMSVGVGTNLCGYGVMQWE